MSMNKSNNFETRRADTVPDGQQKSRVAPGHQTIKAQQKLTEETKK
jgi:hypothetical protein